MNRLCRVALMLAALFLSANSSAGDIEITGAWARATAPGQDTASVDMVITSKHEASLQAATARISRAASLHHMVHEDGMMRMREVNEIRLPAGESVDLGESGYHLMLEGLQVPLKAGDDFPLRLTIKLAKQGTVEVATTVLVRPLGSRRNTDQQDHHRH